VPRCNLGFQNAGFVEIDGVAGATYRGSQEIEEIASIAPASPTVTGGGFWFYEHRDPFSTAIAHNPLYGTQFGSHRP